MFEIAKSLIPFLVPLFVVSTMLNVGFTQKVAEIVADLRNLRFVVKMLIANFVAAPLAMIVMLYLAPFEPSLKAGLLLFEMIIAAQNFTDHPDVLAMLALANLLAIVLLMFIAKMISRDNHEGIHAL